MFGKVVKKNFKSKLHLIASNDELRPVLQVIYFDNGYAIVTDAHMLVKQSLKLHDFDDFEIEQMNGKYLHAKGFKEVLKYDHVTVEGGKLICVKDELEVQITLKEMETLGKYPNYGAVIPAMKDNAPVKQITLNSKFLAKIANVTVGEYSEVSFAFFDESKAVICKGKNLDWNEETILVMPIQK